MRSILFLIIFLQLSICICQPSIAKVAKQQLLDKVDNWEIYAEPYFKSFRKCHAVLRPYNTKVFHGVRNNPYIAISLHSNDNLSLTVYPGFLLDYNFPPIIQIHEKEYALLILDGARSASPYTFEEDKFLIQKIQQNDFFGIKSQNTVGRIAIDFYKVTNLNKAIDYMNRKCSIKME